MKLTRFDKNVHQLDIGGTEMKLAIMGDLHWDSPYCDREKLKRDLDYCLDNSIPILGIGDWFDLMASKKDFRGSKNTIRPEFKSDRYFDLVTEHAVEWFSPYAHLIQVLGMGNHETSILKHQESCPMTRFVDLMNYKNTTKIQVGGYGGWFLVRMKMGNMTANTKIKYFHGSGGASPMTQGSLNLSRSLMQYESADAYVMGHVHYDSSRTIVREEIKSSRNGAFINYKEVHQLICGTYKEEFKGGSSGWHVERGAGVKPTGARILTIKLKKKKTKESNYYREQLVKEIDSHRFPR
jgi:hypothetical protein